MFARQSSFRLLLSCLTITATLVGCASVPPAAVPPALPTSAAAGDTTIVAIAAPGKSSCSVWDLLGVEQAVGAVAAGKHRIRDHIASKLGMRFPGLEPIPELKLITDPANLAEAAPPTAKAAAEVKMKEDQAAQKIKGIRYLASIGCGGCYPDVEDAFLQALEDCTEEVRYEAVLALRKTTGKECSFCSHRSCCSEKIQKKMYEMTTLDCDCYNEPSQRVRRHARLVLQHCGPEIRVDEADEPIGDDPGEEDLVEPSSEGDAEDEELEEGLDGEDAEQGLEKKLNDDDEVDLFSPPDGVDTVRRHDPAAGDLALGSIRLPLEQLFRPW